VGRVADCKPEEDSMYPGLNILIYGHEVYIDSTLNPSPPLSKFRIAFHEITDFVQHTNTI
jgi:hypothetical protein